MLKRQVPTTVELTGESYKHHFLKCPNIIINKEKNPENHIFEILFYHHSVIGLPFSSGNTPDNVLITSTSQPIPKSPPVKRYRIPIPILFT